MLLSGVSYGKNLVSLGYPMVEAILTLMPAVDDFVFLEGKSEDNTMEYLERIREKFPEKFRIEQTDWPEVDPTDVGYSIGKMQTKAMRLGKGWYNWVLQADEVYYPGDVTEFRVGIEKAMYNTYSPYFQHIHTNFQIIIPDHWEGHPETAAYSFAPRIARNIDTIYANHDGWQFAGNVNPHVNVKLPHPVYHCGYEFPLNLWKKQINHAKLYPGFELYQETARTAQAFLDHYHKTGELDELYLRKTSPHPIPPILEGLVGMKEYKVRESLFQ